MSKSKGAIPDAIFENDVLSEPTVRLARNAVSNNDLLEVLQDRDIRSKYNYVYSNRVSTEGDITSQKSSGRCWMFAMMNVARIQTIRKYNLSNSFEFSQSYLFFYDKLERSNFFLENIIESRNEDVGSRIVCHLLSNPMEDGGQWDMLINLVEKYGLVPKSVFPECHCSSSSRRFNWFLSNKLRGWAQELRSLASKTQEGDDVTSLLREAKNEMMKHVYRMLVIFFGLPPSATDKFDWTYYDKDKKFGCIRDLTPQSFYANHVPYQITSKISLINDPRNAYWKLYTVDKLGNVAGGRGTSYINLPIEELKRYACKTIDGDEPVWFGCDVGKFFHRKLSVMDSELYDYQLAFGTAPNLDKKGRLLHGDSLMTHAMTFTGYDEKNAAAVAKVKDDKEDEKDTEEKKGDIKATEESAKDEETTPYEVPTVLKWRVENSWGEEGADKGYYLMTDSWFDEYMYQVVVDKSILSSEILAVLQLEPLVLPAWDPMGALAKDIHDFAHDKDLE